MQAALLRKTGDETLDVVTDMGTIDVGPGLVRVAIKATGVCHSDLSAINGTIPQPAPVVLGHEGSGEVVEVGLGVSKVAPGDHVIVAFIAPCGVCSHCLGGQANLCEQLLGTQFSPRFVHDGTPVFGMGGCGTFS